MWGMCEHMTPGQIRRAANLTAIVDTAASQAAPETDDTNVTPMFSAHIVCTPIVCRPHAACSRSANNVQGPTSNRLI
jgi:hypothetical protein